MKTKEQIKSERLQLEEELSGVSTIIRNIKYKLAMLQHQCIHQDGFIGDDFGPGSSKQCPICGLILVE